MEKRDMCLNQPKHKVRPRGCLARRTFFTLILSLLSAGITLAQKTQITGTVVDPSGLPLPGVSIVTNDKSINGTTTDGDGNFTLNMADGKQVKTLTFSFVGMQTQVVPYKGGKMRIVLKENAQQIEEVVVTGMYERKKEGFTGSANTMSGDDIRKMASGNVLKAIELLDPGFRMGNNMMAAASFNKVMLAICSGSMSMILVTLTPMMPSSRAWETTARTKPYSCEGTSIHGPTNPYSYWTAS